MPYLYRGCLLFNALDWLGAGFGELYNEVADPMDGVGLCAVDSLEVIKATDRASHLGGP